MEDSPRDTMIPSKICYVILELKDLNVFDPSIFSENRVSDFKLAQKLIDFRFNEGYYFDVHQFSLSREALSYWSNVKELNIRKRDVFDEPVGEVTSNIYNVDDADDIVFGYFFASEEWVYRIKVPLDFIDKPEPICPPSMLLYLRGIICARGDCVVIVCC